MKKLIEEYSELATTKWKNFDRSEELHKQMNAICDKEAASFKKRIKSLFQASETWSLFDVRGHANIDHSCRPVEVSTTIDVEAGYYRDHQRGTIKLYGALDEQDVLFAEVDRLINGVLPMVGIGAE